MMGRWEKGRGQFFYEINRGAVVRRTIWFARQCSTEAVVHIELSPTTPTPVDRRLATGGLFRLHLFARRGHNLSLPERNGRGHLPLRGWSAPRLDS